MTPNNIFNISYGNIIMSTTNILDIYSMAWFLRLKFVMITHSSIWVLRAGLRKTAIFSSWVMNGRRKSIENFLRFSWQLKMYFLSSISWKSIRDTPLRLDISVNKGGWASSIVTSITSSTREVNGGIGVWIGWGIHGLNNGFSTVGSTGEKSKRSSLIIFISGLK